MTFDQDDQPPDLFDDDHGASFLRSIVIDVLIIFGIGAGIGFALGFLIGRVSA